MKLDDIYDLWEIDSQIDRVDLNEESLKISKLHHKYFKIFSHERLVLKKYETDLAQLKLAKYEFYTQGPSEETQKLGWKMPACGKILKSEVSSYMDADPDMIKQILKISTQKEKIDLLESIIKSLKDRGFNIKNAIEWEKFKMGA